MSEESLRKREPAASQENTKGENTPGKDSKKSNVKSDFAAEIVSQVGPAWAKPYAKKIGAVLAVFGNILDQVSPYWEKLMVICNATYKKLEPYHPDDLALMLFGLIMMFFGGSFMTTIACIEAFRLAGWQQFQENIGVLWANYKEVNKQWKEDDKRDDNGDGIPDVQQIGKQQLLTRKLRIFLTSSDPKALSAALSGIYTGFIAVLATLRVQFARIITLGTTIGECLAKPCIKYLHPPIAAMLPQEYHKWIDVVISYTCKSIGVSIAWTLQRLVAAVHSALRGAQMFTESFATWTGKLGYPTLSNGYFDEVFAIICAVLGFYWQLSSWFTLPWIMWLPLFPLIFVERVLTVLVAFV